MFWQHYPVLDLYGMPGFLCHVGFFFVRPDLSFYKWLSIWTVRLWKRKQEKIQTKHYFTLTWLDLASCLCKTRQNIFFLNFTILTWTSSGNILVFRSLTDYISVILTEAQRQHWTLNRILTTCKWKIAFDNIILLMITGLYRTLFIICQVDSGTKDQIKVFWTTSRNSITLSHPSSPALLSSPAK